MFRRVVCGISGGVDSAIAAYLLKQKGFEVIGVFMKNWDPLDEYGTCLSGGSDLSDAIRVCEKLDIEFHEVSFIKEYWNDVFSSLLQDYENGITPNPDILCNRFVKFGAFYNYARNTLKADAISTGHYARSSFDPFLKNFQLNEDAKLLRAKDFSKDQTFFLSQIGQEPLRRTIFPLGSLYKSQVRDLARSLGMDFLVKKKESTGICFIGNRKFANFIEEYIPEKRGPFINVDTKEVAGWHQGVHQWTLGQRCRISGLRQSLFVVHRDPKNQIIYVSNGYHKILNVRELTTVKPHWIAENPLECNVTTNCNEPLLCMFKFQHSVWPMPSFVLKLHNDPGLKVRLSLPKRAVSPGQFAVFYKGNSCLGSAKILSTDINEVTFPEAFTTSSHHKEIRSTHHN